MSSRGGGIRNSGVWGLRARLDYNDNTLQPSQRLCRQDEGSCDMSDAPELHDLRNTAQESPRLPIPRLTTAQDTTIADLPVESSAKRARQAEIQIPSKSLKISGPNRTPQRSSSQLNYVVYHSPDYIGKSPIQRENSQQPEAVAANASWAEALPEAQQMAHRVAPEAHSGAIPATALADAPQTPQCSATDILYAVSPSAVPVTAPAMSLSEGESAIGDGQTILADLENEKSAVLKPLSERSEFSQRLTTSNAVNLGTYTLEHPKRKERAPEATMEPFMIGENQWKSVNKSLQRMSTAASDGTDIVQINTMALELLPKQAIAKYPRPLRKMHGATAGSSQKCSVRPPLQTAATPKLRLVVHGPRSFENWALEAPLEELTMKKIKEEIPLKLSPEFRGFIFIFVGGGYRHRLGTVNGNERECIELVEATYRYRFEIKDGDEREFTHLKLDVQERMEESQETNQGNGVYLAFQLYIKELRGSGIKGHNNAGS